MCSFESYLAAAVDLGRTTKYKQAVYTANVVVSTQGEKIPTFGHVMVQFMIVWQGYTL